MKPAAKTFVVLATMGVLAAAGGATYKSDPMFFQEAGKMAYDHFTLPEECQTISLAEPRTAISCTAVSVQDVMKNPRITKAEHLTFVSSDFTDAKFTSDMDLEIVTATSPKNVEALKEAVKDSPLKMLQITAAGPTVLATSPEIVYLHEVYAKNWKPVKQSKGFAPKVISSSRLYQLDPRNAAQVEHLDVDYIEAKVIDLQAYKSLSFMEITTPKSSKVLLPKHISNSKNLTVRKDSEQVTYSFLLND